MEKSVKGFKTIIYIYVIFIFILIIFMVFSTSVFIKSSKRSTDSGAAAPFALNNAEIVYKSNDTKDNSSSNSSVSPSSVSKINRVDVLSRAKEMADIKWIPQYNITDSYSNYTFKNGKTYIGVPYSMDMYQVDSAKDFVSKINGSGKLYGNDCSGFVSAAWGISRQTTLTLNNAAKQGLKVNGRLVNKIDWKDLKPGDAILLDNGKGKGHIVLYIDTDAKNQDRINVYEQNISTAAEAFPVARKDIRSKQALQNQGYIPITLEGLN